MKQIAKRLTYANVMSSIAVFLVLGGATAFAATQVRKNSVGTNQLKNDSITTAKLKRYSVTGEKINLGTLGTVPSATKAEHAENAKHAETADQATNFSDYVKSGLVKASVGQTVTIASSGPFKVIGKCEEESANHFRAAAYMTTTSSGSSETSYMESYNGGEFEPGIEAELLYPANGTEPEISYSYGGYETGFNAISGDGATIISGEVMSGVHLYGADCVYWAHILDEG